MPSTETSPSSSPSIFGRGLYSVPEAARLIGVNPKTLRRWADGYDFKGRGGAVRYSQPLTKRELESRAGFVELTFVDLVEFLFIANFVQAGVSLYTIRKAALAAAQVLGVEDHPFCVRGFKTDGKQIFAAMELERDQLQPGERKLLQLASRQLVFVEVVEPFLLKFEYDIQTDLVKRWWPLGRDRQVMVDPTLNFGAPVLKGSGVPTETIRQFSKDRRVAEIADWYEITPQAVEDALAFENRPKAA